MRGVHVFRALAGSVGLALSLSQSTSVLQGQSQDPQGPGIPSLTEAGQGLTIKSVADSGRVT